MPATPNFEWQVDLSSDGIGGIAANKDYVVVGSWAASNAFDVFTCHSLKNGEQIWNIKYVAVGNLDYGNSPRATPLIFKNKVVLQGAFGHVHVVELESGTVVWSKNFVDDFGAEIQTW